MTELTPCPAILALFPLWPVLGAIRASLRVPDGDALAGWPPLAWQEG